MRYRNVYIESIGFELAPVVVSSVDLEERLAPVYQALHVPKGQLVELTGIEERRWWEAGTPLSFGAIRAGKKALAASSVQPKDLDVLIYAGVCRENFEPATACRVAHGVGTSPRAALFDISNACLGVLNGMVEVANRIELGQIRAGMVVSCETAREINEIMLDRLLRRKEMEFFKVALTTFTGGSGAVAVLLSDGSFSGKRRRFLGGVCETEPQFYDLCRWSVEEEAPMLFKPMMRTDSVGVMKNGSELGVRTWKSFLQTMEWRPEQMDKVICHQVGSKHRQTMLGLLQIPLEKDFSSYPFLGNMGTVALPLTAALAEERGFLQEGDRVAWLGIGSGLNCMMLGVEW